MLAQRDIDDLALVYDILKGIELPSEHGTTGFDLVRAAEAIRHVLAHELVEASFEHLVKQAKDRAAKRRGW